MEEDGVKTTVTINEKIKKLNSFLVQYNYQILCTYCKDDYIKYIKIINNTNGNMNILTIPSQYELQMLSDSIHLHSINKPDCDIKKEDIYEKISDDQLVDENKYLSPQDIDKLLAYDSIDINIDDNLSIYNESVQIKEQLNRFKNCVEDLKYKVCIESRNCFCLLNNDNEIKCYQAKLNNEKKRMYITIDLETFYLKINDIQKDTNTLYKKLQINLNKTHNNQVTVICKYLDKFKSIGNQLQNKYNTRDMYNKKINSITEKIKKLSESEITLKKDFKNYTDMKSETEIIKYKSIENEIMNIEKLKKEAIDILVNLQNSYDNFILEFETILVNNIELLKTVADNFERIGISRKG